MGQIFDRIKRITNSYFTDVSSAESFLDSQDDELKRIIDELNNPQKSKSETNYNNSYQYKNREDGIPKNIIDAFNVIGLNVNSDIETIKLTFKKKIKENHPDKFQNADEFTKKNASRKSQELINAYNLIKGFKGF